MFEDLARISAKCRAKTEERMDLFGLSIESNHDTGGTNNTNNTERTISVDVIEELVTACSQCEQLSQLTPVILRNKYIYDNKAIAMKCPRNHMHLYLLSELMRIEASAVTSQGITTESTMCITCNYGTKRAKFILDIIEKYFSQPFMIDIPIGLLSATSESVKRTIYNNDKICVQVVSEDKQGKDSYSVIMHKHQRFMQIIIMNTKSATRILNIIHAATINWEPYLRAHRNINGVSDNEQCGPRVLQAIKNKQVDIDRKARIIREQEYSASLQNMTDECKPINIDAIDKFARINRDIIVEDISTQKTNVPSVFNFAPSAIVITSEVSLHNVRSTQTTSVDAVTTLPSPKKYPISKLPYTIELSQVSSYLFLDFGIDNAEELMNIINYTRMNEFMFEKM
jgi:hypothetical protein